MATSVTVTSILTSWNEFGVFSYILPFLIVFAVTYGILAKTNLFKDNKPVNTITAIAIGLLALQLDFVPTFFKEIFPRFGIGLSILLVFIILVGFFANDDTFLTKYEPYGAVVAVAILIWAISSWNWSGDYAGIGSWFKENFWALILGILIVTAIYFIVRTPKPASVAAHSDLRLKFNLKKIGVSRSGINIYSFRYRDKPQELYRGVVAQELLNTQFSGAVVDSGKYLAVDYSKIDVQFQRID